MRADIETCLDFFHTLGFEAEVTADSIIFPIQTPRLVRRTKS